MPVAGRPWLVTEGPARVSAETTGDRLAAGELGADLATFHAVVLEALALDDRRSAETEGARASRRAEDARSALREGSGHLASILMPGGAAADAAAADALLLAARRVGRELGVAVKAPPERGGAGASGPCGRDRAGVAAADAEGGARRRLVGRRRGSGLGHGDAGDRGGAAPARSRSSGGAGGR